MAAELLLNPGYHKNGYFLLRGPATAADTLLTAANVNRSLKQLKPGTAIVQYVDIGAWDGVRIAVFGQTTDNFTALATLYGWKDFLSPASLIGQVTCTLSDTASQDNANAAPGWHTDAEVDDKLRGAMAANEDWFACDTFVDGVDLTSAITVTAAHLLGAVQFPAWFEVSLVPTQYQFMALMFTGVGGGGTEMTKAVAAYSPISGKSGMSRIGI
jgi:hypothetical protein